MYNAYEIIQTYSISSKVTSEAFMPSINFMQQALDLAEQAIPKSPPNPAVGCIIVDKDNQIIGRGNTQAVGFAHAEIMALRAARVQGKSTQGSHVYVTLEPCVHYGRTPPCCDAIVAAGVTSVSVALVDPNPLVAGQGLAKLRAHGIHVYLMDPTSQEAIRASQVMQGFLSRIQRGRPWVRLKVAASLDGYTALQNGQSRWITGPEAREDNQHWRARASAILTGIGTILADDPLLNVRLKSYPRQPDLIILDRELRTPHPAKFWATVSSQRKCFIYTNSLSIHKTKAIKLKEQGAHIAIQHDLLNLLQDLAKQHEVNELHIEAGNILNGAWLESGLVDEVLLYLAPMFLGNGKPMANRSPLEKLEQAILLTDIHTQSIGKDLRITAKTQHKD
jgi:diaminohydroxyphosphoribosylaminopyrimidine deaminase/5-amino-6-(5-phosphoribosylamino)uracil reductase